MLLPHRRHSHLHLVPMRHRGKSLFLHSQAHPDCLTMDAQAYLRFPTGARARLLNLSYLTTCRTSRKITDRSMEAILTRLILQDQLLPRAIRAHHFPLANCIYPRTPSPRDTHLLTCMDITTSAHRQLEWRTLADTTPRSSAESLKQATTMTL